MKIFHLHCFNYFHRVVIKTDCNYLKYFSFNLNVDCFLSVIFLFSLLCFDSHFQDIESNIHCLCFHLNLFHYLSHFHFLTGLIFNYFLFNSRLNLYYYYLCIHLTFTLDFIIYYIYYINEIYIMYINKNK